MLGTVWPIHVFRQGLTGLTADADAFPFAKVHRIELKQIAVALLERVTEAILHFDDIFVQNLGIGDLSSQAPSLDTLLQLHAQVL